MILYNHCVVILMLLCCELAALLWYYTIIVWWYWCYFPVNWQLCCDTIQSLCGDINVTLQFELAALLGLGLGDEFLVWIILSPTILRPGLSKTDSWALSSLDHSYTMYCQWYTILVCRLCVAASWSEGAPFKKKSPSCWDVVRTYFKCPFSLSTVL